MPATPLPAERNGIELVPADTAQAVVADAVAAQASGVAHGTLVRRLTDQETETTSETNLEFRTEGNETVFSAQATWGELAISIVATDGAWWVTTNEAYATYLGVPQALTGVCVTPENPIAQPWQWLAGPGAVLAAVGSTWTWGAGETDEAGMRAVFPVAESGVVVGSIEVEAKGAALPVVLSVDDPSGRGSVNFGGWSLSAPSFEARCDPEVAASQALDSVTGSATAEAPQEG